MNPFEWGLPDAEQIMMAGRVLRSVGSILWHVGIIIVLL